MRNWYLFYSAQAHQSTELDLKTRNRPQLVNEIFQIPWGHNREIITKCGSVDEAIYYVRKTISNNWSRAVLIHQIESRLIKMEGQAITNFRKNLPEPQSDLAHETIKGPYHFDFLNLIEKKILGPRRSLIRQTMPRQVDGYDEIFG